MCVVSMVYDSYRPKFDRLPQVDPAPVSNIFTLNTMGLAELRQLIAEFKEALAAAKTVGKLTGQPDCEDPKKAELEQRVAALEKVTLPVPKYWVVKNDDGEYLSNRDWPYPSYPPAWTRDRANAARFWTKQAAVFSKSEATKRQSLRASRVVRVVGKCK